MMTKQMQVGLVNRLQIRQESEYGLYLSDETGEEVLLPRRYVTEDMKIGDTLECFIYTDSEDRLVATTERPVAMRGAFALMEVTDIVSFGAFVDWGLPKELLVPNKMQKNRLEKGGRYIIRVAYDLKTDRLVGDTRIGRYLEPADQRLAQIGSVDMLIVARTPLGYKAIVNNQYEGMLYHTELFEPLHAGDQRTGYIKKVREDGKLDLSLQPIGEARQEAALTKVRHALENAKGSLPLTYKSDADAIRERLGISKKAFKKALTTLIDNDEIVLHADRITQKEKR